MIRANWYSRHENLVHKGKDIMALIHELSNFKYNGSNKAKISSKIRISLQYYTNEISNLKAEATFLYKTNGITTTDYSNRISAIDNLTSRFKSLEDSFKTNLLDSNNKDCQKFSPLQSIDKRNFHKQHFPKSNEPANDFTFLEDWDINEDDEEYIDIIDSDRKRLINKGKLHAEQENNLEILANQVSKQKQTATQINREVQVHVDIIDDISGNLGKVNQRMNKATHNIMLITRHHKTWPYWLIIIFLLILILIVTFI
ncbi:syntaxin-8-like isoform X2 [Gordionus sp. m RMFG-2023]|uniref:syntaxin-8-like isoform X2 n=1 Tax=Gordionus sp. m RMFG-2023 TaxID=3053472 RepID=UPI0031FBE1A2